MKIKTAEATPIQLDWLVAKCEGYNPDWDEVAEDFYLEPHPSSCFLKKFRPTTNWAQGGPIIEREKIDTNNNGSGEWAWGAGIRGDNGLCYATGYGSTILIAAMRCYVASKLGDEVEVPEELT